MFLSRPVHFLYYIIALLFAASCSFPLLFSLAFIFFPSFIFVVVSCPLLLLLLLYLVLLLSFSFTSCSFCCHRFLYLSCFYSFLTPYFSPFLLPHFCLYLYYSIVIYNSCLSTLYLLFLPFSESHVSLPVQRSVALSCFVFFSFFLLPFSFLPLSSLLHHVSFRSRIDFLLSPSTLSLSIPCLSLSPFLYPSWP